MTWQNKPGIRLIATDIDGTLADEQGEIRLFTLRVLQRLLDQGLPVALVTGLNPWPVKRYVQQIGHGIRAICLNGIFRLEEGELQPGSFVDFDVAVAAAQIIHSTWLCTPGVWCGQRDALHTRLARSYA